MSYSWFPSFEMIFIVDNLSSGSIGLDISTLNSSLGFSGLIDIMLVSGGFSRKGSKLTIYF